MDREPEPLIVNQPMLGRIVKKCLAKDPDDRWQSAADLKSEIERLLEAPAPIAAQQRTSARLPWVLAGLFAGVIAALLLSFALFIDHAPAPPAVVRFEIPPPDGTSWDTADFPVISPDGSRIMFGATKRDGTRHLWVRRLDSVNAQPIPGTESGRAPPGAWSPDGRSIAYVADGTLRRLEMSGGSSQILSPVPAVATPAWGPAGIIVFTGGESPRGLYQVPASGGEAKPAMASSRGFFPSFLPDGRRFLFCDSTTGGIGGSSALYIGLLDSKEGKLLAAGSSGVFVPPSWLLYVRGSTLVAQPFDPAKQSFSGDPIAIADQVAIIAPFNGGAFSVSQNGVLAYRRALTSAPNVLTWYNRQGKKLATVGEQAVYSGPALSPDGKRLAVGRLDPATNTRDIWVLDLVRGVSSRLTFDKADDVNPVWSPDGSRIAFSSDRRGNRDLYWKAASGAVLYLETARVHRRSPTVLDRITINRD